MKLLSRAETKDKRESRNAVLESKSTTLDEAIVAKRKELLDLDEEFLRSMQDQRFIRLKEDAEWNQRTATLRNEVEELERRREKALVPLVAREKEIEDRDTVLLQREEKVSRREDEAANNLELLELRLDEASDRLESVAELERQLDKRERGIKMQEKETSERTEQFNAVLISTLADIQEERAEITRLDTERIGRETALSEREIRFAEKEKDLVSRERGLTDRYLTLERAIKENDKKLHG